MSHFYGVIENGGRYASTRVGHKSNGLKATAASWHGAVTVELSHDPVSGKDRFRVTVGPWKGSGPTPQVLVEGELP